jgi:hypothetical protein
VEIAFKKRLNLDTIGRAGKLAFQYAASLDVDRMPEGAGTVIIRNDTRQEIIDAEDADDVRSELMDMLTEHWHASGDRGIVQFERCLTVLYGAAQDWAEAHGRTFGEPVS